jgi:hypothetical protein
MDITTNLGNAVNDSYDYMNNLLTNPTLLIILVIVIISYIILFMSLGSTNKIDNTELVSNKYSNWLIVLLVAIFIILVIINGLQYFFGIDVVASIKNVFSKQPEIDITIDTSRLDALKDSTPKILLRKQVFNIPGNDYNYYDAKALCKAYDSKLATYSQLEEAYKDGADWCNYGWSDKQMALYPTQMEKWKQLQKIKGHENDCGRPGINGGHISNPALRFGVNCYGYKPRMTEKEEELMATQPLYPRTKKDIAMENRVDYWKSRLSEILISPFNHNSWSRL